MAGVDFRVIFEEGVQGEKPAAKSTADLPSASRSGRDAASKTTDGRRDQTTAEALYGAGRYAAGQAGLGPVVSTLETIGKHLANILASLGRVPTSAGDAAGRLRGSVRVPDASGVEAKKAPGSSNELQEGFDYLFGKGPPKAPRWKTKGGGGGFDDLLSAETLEMFQAAPKKPYSMGAATQAAGTAGGAAASAAASGTAGGVEALGAAATGAEAGVGGLAAALVANPIGAALLVASAAVLAFAAVIGLAIAAVVKGINILHTEGERLQDYSGNLAKEFAMSDVRAMRADMRRAQRLGPDIAVVENIRSRILEKISDIVTEIYALLAKFIVYLQPALEELVGLLGVVAESVPAMADMLKALYQLTTMNPVNIADALREDPAEKANRQRMERAVVRYFEGKEKEGGIGPMDGLMATFLGIGLPPQAGVPGGARAGWNLRPGIGGGVPAGFGGP